MSRDSKTHSACPKQCRLDVHVASGLVVAALMSTSRWVTLEEPQAVGVAAMVSADCSAGLSAKKSKR